MNYKNYNLISTSECDKITLKEVQKYYSKFINPALSRSLKVFSFGNDLVKSANNITIKLANKSKILDFTGGLGVLNFGHNPKNILNFIKYINNDYDCIYGSRFCKDGKMLNSSLIRSIFSKGGSLLTKFFFSINLMDTTSGYQMFKRNVLKKIINKKLLSRNRFFQTEIKIYTRKLKIKEVPIQYVCKTHTMSFYAIFESIYLLLKIRLLNKNHI